MLVGPGVQVCNLKGQGGEVAGEFRRVRPARSQLQTNLLRGGLIDLDRDKGIGSRTDTRIDRRDKCRCRQDPAILQLRYPQRDQAAVRVCALRFGPAPPKIGGTGGPVKKACVPHWRELLQRIPRRPTSREPTAVPPPTRPSWTGSGRHHRRGWATDTSIPPIPDQERMWPKTELSLRASTDDYGGIPNGAIRRRALYLHRLLTVASDRNCFADEKRNNWGRAPHLGRGIGADRHSQEDGIPRRFGVFPLKYGRCESDKKGGVVRSYQQTPVHRGARRRFYGKYSPNPSKQAFDFRFHPPEA